MLAVVQHDQQVTVGDEPQQGVHRGTAGVVGQAQRAGDRHRHHLRGRDRRQVDVPRPVAEITRPLGGHLHRQPGLAHAARPDQGDQPIAGHRIPQAADFRLAPNETRELGRKIMGCDVGVRAQRREVVAQVGVAQLHHAFGPGQIPQRVGTEVGQPGVGGQLVDDQILGGARQHGLAAVGQVAQARGPVDGRADVVARIFWVPQPHLAGVQADAQPDRRQRRPLQVKGARHRIRRTPERDHEAVALTLLDRADAIVRGDGVGHGLIQPRYRGGHLLGLGLPEPRRPFDIGQQQSHRSGRQLAHTNIAPFGCAHASQLAVTQIAKHQRNG